MSKLQHLVLPFQLHIEAMERLAEEIKEVDPKVYAEVKSLIRIFHRNMADIAFGLGLGGITQRSGGTDKSD